MFENPFKGADADYLLLEFLGPEKGFKRSRLQMDWLGKEDSEFLEDQHFAFRIAPGKLIVPVASDPRWIYKTISRLRLRFSNMGIGSKWKLVSVRGLKLR